MGGAATSIQAPRALAAGSDNDQVVNRHKHCRGIWDIVRCRGTDAGGHRANHPRPHGEAIPTPQSPAAGDPVREASLSPHRQQ